MRARQLQAVAPTPAVAPHTVARPILLLPQPTRHIQDMQAPRLQAIPLAGSPLLDTQAPRPRTPVSSMVVALAATTPPHHMVQLRAPTVVHLPQAFLTPSPHSHDDLV